MENQIDISNQYGKLSALYEAVNFLNDKIIKEQEKLKELKKESEKK